MGLCIKQGAILKLAARSLEVDHQELCDLERDLSSGILLDQGQCQVNPGTRPTGTPDTAVVNINGIGLDGHVGVLASQPRRLPPMSSRSAACEKPRSSQ